MGRGEHFLQSVAGGMAVTAEPLPRVPLIEICGQQRVLIENHQGIVSYGRNEIQVKIRTGHVAVCGDHLKLTKMCKEKLVITGKICTVNLRGRG